VTRIERWTNGSREAVGGGVFVAAGVLLLLATLLVEGSSRSAVIGLVTGALILAAGILFGVPRMKRIVTEDPSRVAGREAHAVRTFIVSAASALGAITVCFGLAYLLRRLSRDAELGFDLGVVVILAASGALIYAGVLQWVLPGRPTRSEK
jgi:hypothetical protein